MPEQGARQANWDWTPLWSSDPGLCETRLSVNPSKYLILEKHLFVRYRSVLLRVTARDGTSVTVLPAPCTCSLLRRQRSAGCCRPMLSPVIKIRADERKAGPPRHFLQWKVTWPQSTRVSIKCNHTYKHLLGVNFSKYWLSYCCKSFSPETDFCLTHLSGCSSVFCSNLTWCEVGFCPSLSCCFPPSWFVRFHSHRPIGKTVRNTFFSLYLNGILLPLTVSYFRDLSSSWYLFTWFRFWQILCLQIALKITLFFTNYVRITCLYKDQTITSNLTTEITTPDLCCFFFFFFQVFIIWGGICSSPTQYWHLLLSLLTVPRFEGMATPHHHNHREGP